MSASSVTQRNRSRSIAQSGSLTWNQVCAKMLPYPSVSLPFLGQEMHFQGE
jgi:hypothetical protein